MAFQRCGLLQDEGLEQSFQFLRDENCQLKKRDHVNSLDPLDKYKLLNMFLSIEKRLSVERRVDCLPIFLDKRTKYFGFIQEIELQDPQNGPTI